MLLLLISLFASALFPATLVEINDLAGITDVKQAYGVTGKGVVIVIHDAFDKLPDNRISHGEHVETIVKSVAPGAQIINMTNIYLKRSTATVQASTKLIGQFIVEKYQPKIVNLSWGDNKADKYLVGYSKSRMKKFLKVLVESGVAVVVSAGNDGELAGTNEFTREQAQWIDEINSDPDLPGAIVLVGSGEVFSPIERDHDDQAKHFMADYSLLAGVSRNHFIVGGPARVSLGLGPESDDPGEGTSFSAPVVTGILALLAEQFPKANGKMLIQLLLGGATKVKSVFERPIVKEALLSRLNETTDFPEEHWRHMPWYDIFGRGVVSATGSFALGDQVFKSDIPIFPKKAQPIVYHSDTRYLEKANSLWPIFDIWLRRAEANLQKQHTDKTREDTAVIIRHYLLPLMVLWPKMSYLPFSAEETFSRVSYLAMRTGDYALAYDIELERSYYLESQSDRLFENNFLVDLTKYLSKSLGQDTKNEMFNQALIRLVIRHPNLNEKRWNTLIFVLRLL